VIQALILVNNFPQRSLAYTYEFDELLTGRLDVVATDLELLTDVTPDRDRTRQGTPTPCGQRFDQWCVLLGNC
jgi:hypothetical protein